MPRRRWFRLRGRMTEEQREEIMRRGRDVVAALEAHFEPREPLTAQGIIARAARMSESAAAQEESESLVDTVNSAAGEVVAERPELDRAIGRSARQWAHLLAANSYVGRSYGELVDHVRQTLWQLHAHLFDPHPPMSLAAPDAWALGHDLAYRLRVTPPAVASSVELLSDMFEEWGAGVPHLRSRRAALVGRFAGGFAEGTQRRTQDEQLVVTRALVTAREDAEQVQIEWGDHYRATMGQAPTAIGTLDRRGLFVEANALLQDMLGRTLDQLHSLRLEDLLSDVDRARGVWRRCSEVLHGRSTGAQVEFQIESGRPGPHASMDEGTQAGTAWGRRVVRMTIRALRAPRGQEHAVVVAEDVSLQRLLERDRLDTATHLADRSLFLDQLDQSLAEEAATDAMLFVIRLGGLDTIATTLGQSRADHVAAAIAERIHNITSSAQSLLGRPDSDLFAVFIPDDPWHDPLDWAKQFSSWIGEPIWVDQYQFRLEPSIGVAERLRDDTRAEQLYSRARRALSHTVAPSNGRQSTPWTVADHAHHAQDQAQLAQFTALTTAVDRDEVYLVYQPLIDLHSGALAGTRAAIRWRDPSGGTHAVAELSELADTTGLNGKLGRWVIDTASHQAAIWHQRHGPRAPFVLVDLPHRFAHEEGVTHHVRAALHTTGLPPELLHLGLSSDASSDDHRRALPHLAELDDLGVCLTLTDYVTGSPASHVKQLPFKEVCMPACLADDESTLNVVHSGLAELAEGLGLGVIVENLDTQSHLHAARQLRHAIGSGRCFSAVATARDLEERWLA